MYFRPPVRERLGNERNAWGVHDFVQQLRGPTMISLRKSLLALAAVAALAVGFVGGDSLDVATEALAPAGSNAAMVSRTPGISAECCATVSTWSGRNRA